MSETDRGDAGRGGSGGHGWNGGGGGNGARLRRPLRLSGERLDGNSAGQTEIVDWQDIVYITQGSALPSLRPASSRDPNVFAPWTAEVDEALDSETRARIRTIARTDRGVLSLRHRSLTEHLRIAPDFFIRANQSVVVNAMKVDRIIRSRRLADDSSLLFRVGSSKLGAVEEQVMIGATYRDDILWALGFDAPRGAGSGVTDPDDPEPDLAMARHGDADGDGTRYRVLRVEQATVDPSTRGRARDRDRRRRD